MVAINNLSLELEKLKPHDKEPKTKSVLDSWIAKAEHEIDSTGSGRVAWLVSTTIAAAKLQSILNTEGKSRFALKGGTFLQHKLGLKSRSTRDLDGIIRGDIEEFLEALDKSLETNWGPISFARSPIESIYTPSKIIKPRRFDLFLKLRGQTWRKVVIEISAGEGNACEIFDTIPAPAINIFGLPTIDQLVCISMSYQIAQKIHAVTDPHDPPLFINNRARDVVDLILLKELIKEDGAPSLQEINTALKDIFKARSIEAEKLNRPVRTLPVEIISYPHWENDYLNSAQDCGITLSLKEAIDISNYWIIDIMNAN